MPLEASSGLIIGGPVVTIPTLWPVDELVERHDLGHDLSILRMFAVSSRPRYVSILPSYRRVLEYPDPLWPGSPQPNFWLQRRNRQDMVGYAMM